MIAQQLAGAIASAPLCRLNDLSRDVWRAWAARRRRSAAPQSGLRARMGPASEPPDGWWGTSTVTRATSQASSENASDLFSSLLIVAVELHKAGEHRKAFKRVVRAAQDLFLSVGVTKNDKEPYRHLFTALAALDRGSLTQRKGPNKPTAPHAFSP